MCKTIYKADDGTEFDNKEECRQYSALPRVWIVTKTTVNSMSVFQSVMGVFTHEKDAIRYANKNSNLVATYKVSREVINKLM